MNSRYEILVVINGVTYTLDTSDETRVTLNYQVSDITTPGSINSSLTLPIELPETANNRSAFGFISDISCSSQFNPNIKSRAYILCDSVVVMDGYIQLTSIKNDFINQNTFLECVIYADTTNFVKSLEEKFITDLNLSGYNHIWNSTNIINSWSGNYQSGYYYPLVDNGYNYSWSDLASSATSSVYGGAIYPGIGVNEMFPATYVRTIWDAMFSEAGYSYKSNFLNSDIFNNLLILFNRDSLTTLSASAITNEMRVGYNSDQTLTASTSALNLLHLNPTNVSSPNGDPYGLWSSGTTYSYTATSQQANQTFNIDMEWYRAFIPNPGIQELSNQYDQPTYALYMIRSSQPNAPILCSPTIGDLVNAAPYLLSPTGSQNQTSNIEVILGVDNFNTSGQPSGWWFRTKVMVNLDRSNGVNFQPLNTGEKIGFFIGVTLPNFGYTPAGYIPNYLGKVLANTTRPDLFDYGTIIYNNCSTELSPGGTMDYNQVLPQQVKQKDFFLWICQMFNLYVEPSKTVNNQLIIEPRDVYYQNGSVVDWTSKVDQNVPVQVQMLSNTQAKTTFFKYKDDKDYLNTNYQTKTQQSYGQYRLEIDNDFSTDINNIEIGFSPTPVSSVDGSDFIIPQIYSYDQNKFKSVASNIRIVQRNRYANGLYPLTIDIFEFFGTQQPGYPYVGMVDDPLNPTVSIEFGQPTALYYQNTEVTDNTLYQNYWYNQMLESTSPDARLVTYEMYLTNNDINSFYFSNNIFIDNQYYKVNKISGFDPSGIKTCTVELIKSIINTPIPAVRPSKHLVILNNTPAGATNRNIGNTVMAANSNIFGSNNYIAIGANNVNVNGSNNVVQYGNSLLYGNGNNILGYSPIVIGSNNTLNSNVMNSIVFGSNTTVTQSNSFVIASQNIVLGGTNSIIIIASGSTIAGAIGLSNVLAASNSTSGNNIIISPGDKLITPSSNSLIQLADTGLTMSSGNVSGNTYSVLVVQPDVMGMISSVGTNSFSSISSEGSTVAIITEDPSILAGLTELSFNEYGKGNATLNANEISIEAYGSGGHSGNVLMDISGLTMSSGADSIIQLTQSGISLGINNYAVTNSNIYMGQGKSGAINFDTIQMWLGNPKASFNDIQVNVPASILMYGFTQSGVFNSAIEMSVLSTDTFVGGSFQSFIELNDGIQLDYTDVATGNFGSNLSLVSSQANISTTNFTYSSVLGLKPRSINLLVENNTTTLHTSEIIMDDRGSTYSYGVTSSLVLNNSTTLESFNQVKLYSAVEQFAFSNTYSNVILNNTNMFSQVRNSYNTTFIELDSGSSRGTDRISITTSNILINGVTAVSGTFSAGGSHVVTVTKGIITSIT